MSSEIEWGPWIEWGGGDEPPCIGLVSVRFRDGSQYDDNQSAYWSWTRTGTDGDITMYRLPASVPGDGEAEDGSITALAARYEAARDAAESLRRELLAALGA